MIKKVKMITDSACDIPYEAEKELDIEIMSFPITIDGEGYFERKDFTPREFYDMMLKAKQIPVTSQLTAHVFEEEFLKYAKQDYTDIIYVSINSKGSNTYNSSVMGKKSFYENHPEYDGKLKIHIVDSLSYSLGYGMSVMEGARKIKQGACAEEVVAYLNDWVENHVVYFVPFTLEYAKKSGRISCAAAFVGELLGLKPIIRIKNGEMKIVDKVRGDKSALNTLLKKIKEDGVPKTPYGIVDSMLSDTTKELMHMVHKELGYKETVKTDVGTAVAINSGPKIAGIVFKEK